MKLVTQSLLDEMIARAGDSPRRRSHHNMHELPEDPVQRLFVAAKRDSYFRAHRHPGKWEFSVVLRGLFDVLTFDGEGRLTQRIAVGPEAGIAAFELPPDTWHAWVPMSDDAVFFEVKRGPYDPQTAAEPAPWAPPEGAPEVAAFAARLREAQVGDCLAG